MALDGWSADALTRITARVRILGLAAEAMERDADRDAFAFVLGEVDQDLQSLKQRLLADVSTEVHAVDQPTGPA